MTSAFTWNRSRVDGEHGAETHYAAADGRFLIKPSYKRPNRYDTRNHTNAVRDGVTLTDTLTRVTLRFDTVKDAKARAERYAAEEAACDFTVAACWHADLGQPGPLCASELTILPADGSRDYLLRTLIGYPYASKDDTAARENIARWLKAMGRPDLPESSGTPRC